MKWISIIILLFIGNICRANMASPIWSGVHSATAITSKDIQIQSEYIYVHINKDFSLVDYTIQYKIQTDTDGLQIPLLFVALNYNDSFNVWVDGNPILIQDVLNKYTQLYKTPFQRFSDAFGKTKLPYDDAKIEIDFDNNDYSFFSLNELKYFETNLTKGTHTIIVKYSGAPTIDRSEWVNKYTIPYSLSPAKFWKSFGSLKVDIEQDGAPKNVSVKVGDHSTIMKNGKLTLSYQSLPGDFITINFVPEIPSIAKALIAINPFGLMIILGILLALLHIKIIIVYRKKHLHKRFSMVVIIGSILLPFIVLLSYMLFYELIDFIIGPDATRHHGYIFLIMIFYPIVMPIYWIILWLIDRGVARKLRMRSLQ